MFTSNYNFTYSPPSFTPDFFDDVGDKELIQQRNEVTNYYKQYAWIQTNDSLLIIIGKIALFCISFTASLWITMLADEWTTEGRNEAFQERLRQLDTAASIPKRDQFIGQTAEDIFRQVIKVNGKDVYQIGWETLPKDQIRSENRQVQQHLDQLLRTFDFNEIREQDPDKEVEDLQAAKSILYDAIKTHVKAEILPGLFDHLKQEHGMLKALQVCDAFSQTLSNKMGDYLFYEFFQYIQEDLPSLHYNCKWEPEERVSSGETEINGSTLILHRNYRLAALEESESVAKARVEVKLTVDIKTLVARATVVIHPSASLKVEQAHAMNYAWRPAGFTMPIPVR